MRQYSRAMKMERITVVLGFVFAIGIVSAPLPLPALNYKL